MKTKPNRTELLHQIRIWHAALLKKQKGLNLLEREIRVLDELAPVDVTKVLLDEIDKLNNDIVNLIYKYSILETSINEGTYLDI